MAGWEARFPSIAALTGGVVVLADKLRVVHPTGLRHCNEPRLRRVDGASSIHRCGTRRCRGFVWTSFALSTLRVP
ncbi:protein of unknown function [Ectopseudomonas oleovorans]|nr:protein of unknown function [Pseudomonas oleovorans]